MDTKSTYTLIEGQSSVDITVNLGIEPDYICLMKYGKICQITFKGAINPISNERTCPGRDFLSPLVIRSQGTGQLSTAICGTVMTKSSASVSVKAVVDGVYFQNNTIRSMKIQENHFVDGSSVFEKKWGIKTVCNCLFLVLVSFVLFFLL